MTAVLAYCAFALLIFVAVVFLLRARRAETVSVVEFGRDGEEAPWEEPDLSLAERIFDRADYTWLRDEVGFASLAESLLHTRTQMALHWLHGLRKSFDKLVRDLGHAPGAHRSTTTRENWNFLLLTLRFHFVVGYAILVVRLFGPYRRLIPSFGWMPSLSVRPSASDPYESADVPRFS
jgi:hypothetical protein